jgi:hypothetical protein
MRPTNFCHLNDLRAPVPRAFPVRYATFIAWTPHGVLGSVRFTGVPSVSRHSWTLRRMVAHHADAVPRARHTMSGAFGQERGRCRPTAAATNRASGTSVASLSCGGSIGVPSHLLSA